MEWTYSINKAIDYMEEHLTDAISASDIAESVNISVFHFQRAFSIMTGMTPTEYLRKRRLSLAGAELAKGDAKVIDVALKYGYNTPECFSKAFSRFHGVTPRQAKDKSALKYFNKLSLKIIIEGGSIMDYTIEKWEALDLLVHTRSFDAETSDKEIPKFWDEYYADEKYNKIPGYLGICAQKKAKGNSFLYGIGCKAEDVDGIPEGFEILHIPEYTWAVFKCVGPSPDAIQKMWEKIYREWLPNTNYKIIQDYDIENYLPGNPNSDDYISEICIPLCIQS